MGKCSSAHIASNMKGLLCFLSLTVGSAISKPAGIGGVGLVGGGGVVGGGHGQAYDYSPDPFHFQYAVHDAKYYTDFSEARTGDEGGDIKGEYSVALPDGNYGGTVMDVKYDGKAHHPDIVQHGGHGGAV